MPAIDLGASLLDQCNAIWAATKANEQAELNLRKVPPVVCLWDGEMRLQHLVQAEYSCSFEIIDGDTGAYELRHPFDHPVGQWLWDEQGRLDRGEKRNINITVEYCGSRLGGLLEYVELEQDEDGDQVVVARFASDYERLKWYSIWANPYFPEWIQWPQIWLGAGPIPWLLSVALDLQIMREAGSYWALPSDPMDPNQRGPIETAQATWSTVVKPISFVDSMASGALWGILISRFKNFHDVAKALMEDGEITCVIRPYLEGDPEPWPGANLRHGTRVVSFEDRSGTYTGTSHGGTIWDGLVRTVNEFVGDMIDSTEYLVTDTSIPPDYYIPGSKRTQKELPFVVWRDGEETGLTGYRYRRTPSKGIQVVTGGHSMPGVNEAISAAIQMAGDLIAAMIGVPPVGGALDAILAPLYTDALLAWMVARSSSRAQNQGWTRYFEYFQEGSNKAYTLSSLIVLRAGIWATRAFDATTFSAGDGAPYLIGESGHVWLGDRAGYTIRGDTSGRIYMDRISKVRLSWSRDEPVEWTLTVGDDRALQDPVARAWERIEAIISALQQLGVV
ncbi:phage tail protein [Nocardia gipuzkoensis]|uniref:Gp37-like protein n=1 Tax=Nocardia gipuzkoensis TaxID=2749991 RepID=UPI001E48B243|nr:phage tail protein [Nocardia gipuzkoensis]UGT65334.1 phage tail protein [Nocardia gipuzkoensis]